MPDNTSAVHCLADELVADRSVRIDAVLRSSAGQAETIILVKPFTAEEMAEAIRKVIGR